MQLITVLAARRSRAAEAVVIAGAACREHRVVRQDAAAGSAEEEGGGAACVDGAGCGGVRGGGQSKGVTHVSQNTVNYCEMCRINKCSM